MKKLILSQIKSKPISSSSIAFHRYLSSDNGIPIQPVSYPVKSKQENPEKVEETVKNQENLLSNQELTREDLRYVKDSQPSVSLSSYATKVAPLPEDKKFEEIDEESRKIEGETNINRRMAFSRVVEEEEKVPFPKLMKSVKRETKPVFDLMDAIRQVKANARTTFDETIEAHARLGIIKNRSDLIVRGTLTLPHGTKKVIRVAVFAEGADADEARAAGADVVGGVELIDQIASEGKIDFDKCYATTKMFPRVVKLARILNRHGLMPNAKEGTVITDVSRAVKEAKKSQVKFKMDKASIVHVGLGKASLTEESLRENIGAFMHALLQAKPAGLKKTSKYAGYVNSVHICSTMGPGFPVSIQSLSKAVDQYNKIHLKAPA